MKKFSKQAQLEIVKEILSCELLMEEAMAKYGIKSKATVIRWVKQHRSHVQELINMMRQQPLEEEMPDFQKKWHTQSQTIHRLYTIIELLERLYQLDNELKSFPDMSISLVDELNSVMTKVQTLKNSIHTNGLKKKTM